MKKRLVFSGLISIFLIVVLLIGSTYSLFVTSNVDDNLNVYKTGNLDITYTVSDNNKIYSSMIPVSSDAVERVKPYRVTVNNVGNVPYKFNVILNNTTVTDSVDSKYIVTKVGKLEPKTLDNCENGIIKKDVIVPAGESAIIDVRVYLNETIQNTEIGKSFLASLSIDGMAIYNESDEIDNSILMLSKKTLVSFDANGGVIAEGDECIEVESSSKYNDFPVVSRVGYTFVGWFTEDDVEVTEGNDLVTEDDHTLEAKWSPKTYTVSFDKNSCTATPSVASKTVTYNEEYGELPITSRENYTFVGWFTKPVGGQLVTSTSKVLITENQTLYAFCSQTEYVVSFDANKGEVEPSSIIVAKGEVYGELPVPTRGGYTFGGWYTDPENGELVTENTVVGINGPQTLYAHWNAISYTVTFDANGGGTPSMESKIVTYDQLYGDLATIGRSGYSFDGWYSEAIGGTKIESTSKVVALGAHTLYAHWSTNSYTVTFDANGEGATVSTSSYTVNFGEEYGEMPTPVRAGYKFDGWFTESSGGSQVTSSTAVTIAGAHTLYAHWSANIIDITLNENGTNAGTTGYSVSLSTSSTSDTATFTGTTSGATISFEQIVAGTTYYIWAGKSSNDKTTRLYSGVSFTTVANTTQSATINYYGLTLKAGTGIDGVYNSSSMTENEIQYLYNSINPQEIAITATANSTYTFSTWTKTSGTNLLSFTPTLVSQSIQMGAGKVTLTASAIGNPVITRSDYNSFTYTASDVGAYYVSTSSTQPSAGSTAASSTFALNTWTTATSTGNLSLNEGETYYVWVKSAATGGIVSSTNASIAVRKITRSPSSGTTLTTRYDATSSSTGTNFTSTYVLVLNGTPFWMKATATVDGSSNGVDLKLGGSTKNAAGDTFNANGNYYIYVTLKTYTITYNANGGSSAPSAQTKTYGEDLTLSTVVPTNTNGYTFLGWGTSSTTTAATYTGGSGILVDTSNNTYTLNKSNTLYAVWGYKVNFYPDDDFYVDLPSYAEDYKICGIGSSASTSGKTCTINLPGVYGVSDSANYYVGAWELYSNQSDTVGYPGDTYTVTKNITLYAFLYKKNYCITYDTTITVSECDCSNDEYYTGRFNPSGTEEVCYFTNSYDFIDQSSSSEIQLLSGTDGNPLYEDFNIVVPSGKTVLIDFNDHYLSFAAAGRGDIITNNGTLIITNSNASSNAYLYGVDGNTDIGSVIVNNGTLTIAKKITIESNNNTSTSLAAIKNAGTMYIGTNADNPSDSSNEGTNVSSPPITVVTPKGYAIQNTSTGVLNMYVGTRLITGGSYTINNAGTANLKGGRLFWQTSAFTGSGTKNLTGSWATTTNGTYSNWQFKSYVYEGVTLTAPRNKYYNRTA